MLGSVININALVQINLEMEFSDETKKTIREYEKAKKNRKSKVFIRLEDLKKSLLFMLLN